MPKSKSRFFLIAILVLLLLAIRGFESQIFYDPLTGYFRSSFDGRPLPGFNAPLLAANLLLRYFLNSAISIAIIWLAFNDNGFAKLSLMLYAALFVVLICVFFAIIYWQPGDYRMLLFYVRRFLIQPLFLLIFLPAFYFQVKVNAKIDRD